MSRRENLGMKARAIQQPGGSWEAGRTRHLAHALLEDDRRVGRTVRNLRSMQLSPSLLLSLAPKRGTAESSILCCRNQTGC